MRIQFLKNFTQKYWFFFSDIAVTLGLARCMGTEGLGWYLREKGFFDRKHCSWTEGYFTLYYRIIALFVGKV